MILSDVGMAPLGPEQELVIFFKEITSFLLIEPRQLVPSIIFGGALMYREDILTVSSLFVLRFSQGVFYDS